MKEEFMIKDKATAKVSFLDRLALLPKEFQKCYNDIRQHLLTYKDVKSRISTRCESFKFHNQHLAKISVGGKTLKLYLALDPNDDQISKIRIMSRDVSLTAAYKDVPYLIPIRSNLASQKACIVINQMMSTKNISKIY